MAKFKFTHGTMNSGKSHEATRVIYNYVHERGDAILIVVPSTDTRFGLGILRTRGGEEYKAHPVDPGSMGSFLDEVRAGECPGVNLKHIKAIILDEVQFFTHEDIRQLKRVTYENDIPVLAYGLKTNYMNRLFEGSAACLVYAEEIAEVKTLCKYCDRKAIMNAYIPSKGREGEEIIIGDGDYAEVCNEHWSYLNSLK